MDGVFYYLLFLPKSNFARKKSHEKTRQKNSSKKLCLLLSYIVQKSLHFDEIFLPWKKSVSEFSYPHAMDSIYLAWF